MIFLPHMTRDGRRSATAFHSYVIRKQGLVHVFEETYLPQQITLIAIWFIRYINTNDDI